MLHFVFFKALIINKL